MRTLDKEVELINKIAKENSGKPDRLDHFAKEESGIIYDERNDIKYAFIVEAAKALKIDIEPD